jgi:hypothetical protein
VTETLKGLRVVAVPGPTTLKCVAALLTTPIGLEPPVIGGVAVVSAAVIVVLVIVFRVAGKAPVPFANA